MDVGIPYSLMLSIYQDNDIGYVTRVLSDPAIYALMRDDSCPSDPGLMDFSGVDKLNATFLHVSVDGRDAGLFMYLPKGNGVYEAHTALLPCCRGSRALMAARMSVDWVFNNLGCNEITSYAWSDSPSVAWFARMVGLHEVSRAPSPHTRNGQPVEEIRFSVTKEQWPLTRK